MPNHHQFVVLAVLAAYSFVTVLGQNCHNDHVYSHGLTLTESARPQASHACAAEHVHGCSIVITAMHINIERRIFQLALYTCQLRRKMGSLVTARGIIMVYGRFRGGGIRVAARHHSAEERTSATL